ncbi:NAD(P)-binding protein [Epilithonimonas sp.]|uniref:NAD(P)-binding protein n=1 Tax=Epilithonimonas sp. TaxID=2894511 RepID=UPI0035AF20FD
MPNSDNQFSRKSFLKTIFWAGLMLPFLQYCKQKSKTILLKITGTNHVLGHQLWAKDFPKYSQEIKTKFLIVGGGISGLSACRYLKNSNENDFLLVEMENHLGGNASNGENQFSKFPLGAHYLPIPNKEDLELIEFLKECKISLGDDENGLPILDDEQLTFPKEERLFFKNEWQNDLIPQNGISSKAKEEITDFFKLMDEFRIKKDNSGKYWFDIPISKSSEEAKELDRITFLDWLINNNFKSEELLWLLDYSCKDDYGLGLKYVSAWAGIHYFAGRKNNWATNRHDQVFTWPEGNARLAKHLSKFVENKQLKNHLVFDVKSDKENVEVLVFDNQLKISKKIIAEKVLFATPQFVNQHIFRDRKFDNFNYVPWLLATLTLKNEFGGAEELAWDNVIFGTEGLGYINDQHQNLNQIMGEKVITYYRSFSTDNCKKARRKLYNLKEEELKDLVLDDLKVAHPEIEDFIIDIQFHKLGHGMISPVPGFIFGEEKELAKQNIGGKIFFAHSDLSGISIFEEAFYQGIRAAKEMIGI